MLSYKSSIISQFLCACAAFFFFACGTPTTEATTDDLSKTHYGNSGSISTDNIADNRQYTTRDAVGAYICKFDKLPSNYVNKSKGQALYESKTGNTFSKWNFNPLTTIGYMIGGDTFENREGKLPSGSYHEADVDYSDASRGTKRLIYQSGCVIYYTADHYKTFKRLNF